MGDIMAYTFRVTNNTYPQLNNPYYPYSTLSPTYNTLSPTYNTMATALVSPVNTISSISNVIPVGVSTVIHPSNIDSGISDDPFIQKQIKDDIHYKFLDKWLYEDLDNLLKYLVINNSHVRIVKNKQEKKK